MNAGKGLAVFLSFKWVIQGLLRESPPPRGQATSGFPEFRLHSPSSQPLSPAPLQPLDYVCLPLSFTTFPSQGQELLGEGIPAIRVLVTSW